MAYWEADDPQVGEPCQKIIYMGTMDAKVRAYSLETGEELWSDQTEAPSVSNPAIYEYNGRQVCRLCLRWQQYLERSGR